MDDSLVLIDIRTCNAGTSYRLGTIVPTLYSSGSQPFSP